jgi:hypothetical protein
MQHYPKAQEKPKEEGGFWNGLKKFAGSKGGRMLIGGLGSSLAVGLTGGNIGDALGYGVIGAGKTAENLYKQEQDQKTLEEKEAERLARQQESDADRKQQWEIAQANIEAQKDARKDKLDQIREELRLKDQYGAFDKRPYSGYTELLDYMVNKLGYDRDVAVNKLGQFHNSMLGLGDVYGNTPNSGPLISDYASGENGSVQATPTQTPKRRLYTDL